MSVTGREALRAGTRQSLDVVCRDTYACRCRGLARLSAAAAWCPRGSAE